MFYIARARRRTSSTGSVHFLVRRSAFIQKAFPDLTVLLLEGGVKTSLVTRQEQRSLRRI